LLLSLREAQTRLRVRASLTEWARHCGFEPAPHHQLIIKELEAVARGETQNLLIFAPPGSAKSTYVTLLFSAWYLANNPTHAVLAATHSTDFAMRWGRRIRNEVALHASLLGISMATDSQAADRWALKTGGEYYGVGAGTGIAGYRADLGIIDDPFGSREDAFSPTIRAKRWAWYLDDYSMRMKPTARRVMMHCLAGDTRITMADNRLKRLDEIAVGDAVTSWNGDYFVPGKVTAIIDNGPDQTYLIRTRGTEVRANARHPFLVLSEGLKWIRTKDLKPGMRIVRHGMALTPGCHAQSRYARSQPDAAACAPVTTTRRFGLPDIGRHLSGLNIVWPIAENGDTGLTDVNSNASCWSKMAYAPSVGQMAIRESPSIGSQASFPIITTRQGNFAGSYATIATGLPDELAIPAYWSAPSNTCGPDTEAIISVTPYGIERVFDLSVDGTHNFVANGVWTHNTRWHEEDLAGHVLEQVKTGEINAKVVSIPAIAEDNDILGRELGEWLWDDPTGYDYATFLKARHKETSPMMWAALFQQRPTPEEGDYFKAEWLRPYMAHIDPKILRIYGASDYAVTADGGDYTVHLVVGVDPAGRMFLLDIWRKQASSDVWIEAFCDLVLEWEPIEWAVEGGQIKAGLGPFMGRRMRERNAYTYLRQFPSKHDKAVRAQSIRGRMAVEGLYVPQNAPWLEPFRSELLMFPAGKHDDQVDSLGLIGQLLDHISHGDYPERKPEARFLPEVTLDELWNMQERPRGRERRI